MRRTWMIAGSWGWALALATAAAAGDDGPPPLTLPAEAPPTSDQPAIRVNPAAVPSAAKPSSTLRVSSSLLRPRTNAAATPQPRVVKPAPPVQDDGPPALDVPPTATEGPPPLDGPSEMRRLPERPLGAAGTVSRRRQGQADPSDPYSEDHPAPILEPVDSDPNLPQALSLEADDHDGEIKPRDAKPQAPPRRRFGLLPAPFAARARANGNAKDPAIRVEPRSDPAADAALKRKLEARVKEAVGDKAREVEVRVVDRNIVVKAKVDRFWNKRPVRRTIETLPALAGYKAKVEID